MPSSETWNVDIVHSMWIFCLVCPVTTVCYLPPSEILVAMLELEQFQFDPDIPTKDDMEKIEKFKSSILQYTYELWYMDWWLFRPRGLKLLDAFLLQNQQCQRVLEHIYTYLNVLLSFWSVHFSLGWDEARGESVKSSILFYFLFELTSYF